MIRIFITSVTLSLASFCSFAQQKMLTMEDALINPKLTPQNLRILQWVEGTSDYTYTAKKGTIDCIVRSNAINRKSSDTLLTARDMNPEADTVPTVYNWISKDEFAYKQKSGIYVYNRVTRTSTERIRYTEGAANILLSPDNRSAAFTLKNNLYVSTNTTQVQVTNDAQEDILNGEAAHRNEFGISKGIFWSNASDKVAFYRMDQTMVTNYPLVEIGTKPATLKNIKYPMAGQKSHEVTIGIYDLKKNKTIFLKTGGTKDHYLTNITWSPDDKFIFIAEVTRDYTTMDLNQYDANTGEFIKTLFTEKDEKYVEPSQPLIFTAKDRFIWHSERDGFKHLYLYDINGKLIRQLTSGNWVVTDFLGYDQKDQLAYYMSTEVSPLERHLYSLDLQSGARKKLTAENGTHIISLSPDKKFYIDQFSNQNTPRKISISNNKGVEVKSLLVAANPLKDYSLGETNIFTIKAADNQTDLYCRMVKPVNFDPQKKYPVIVYVYGGPHVQLVTNNWLSGANLWYHLMAQKGYIVFTVDSRGSMNRGKDFEQAIFRNLGVNEVADQMKGVDYLKSLSFVDTNRMGVHGWSYGGFMTTSLMLKQNKTFKAGVAGGPVMDWGLYEIMYTERYMDTPAENPEGYKNANLTNYVDQLKGRLLIIHGTMDDVVVWQHSQEFIKSCVDKGIQADYFIYPGHKHNVRGKDRVHLMNKVTRYFDDFLK